MKWLRPGSAGIPNGTYYGVEDSNTGNRACLLKVEGKGWADKDFMTSL